jgi:hypothetical protein
MLTIIRPISDSSEHVFNVVSEQLVRRAVDELGWSRIFDDRIHNVSMSSVHAHSEDDNHNPSLQNENRISYTQSVSVNPADMEWNEGYYRENMQQDWTGIAVENRVPVFFDINSMAAAYDWMMPCRMQLECTFNMRSRSDAYELLTGIHKELDAGMHIHEQDLVYDYPVPADVYTLMYMVSQLHGNKPEHFLAYLQKCSNGGIGIRVNRFDTSRRELVVKKNHRRVVVYYECPQGEPEAVKTDQANASYQINMTITCQFERPEAMIFRYPPVVNNTMIPGEAILMDEEDFSVETRMRSPFFNEEAYRMVLAAEDNNQPIAPIHVPWYDRWYPKHHFPTRKFGYFAFGIVLFTLDDAENPAGETVIPLDNMGDALTLVPDVLAELTSGNYNPFYMENKYNIAVYSNDFMVEPSTLSLVGTDLHIPCRNKRRVHRLVFSVNENLFNEVLHQHRVFIIDINVAR